MLKLQHDNQLVWCVLLIVNTR